MTRKDYILLAEALHKAYVTNSGMNLSQKLNGVGDAAGFIADALEAENPRFDHAHFLAVVRGEKDLNSRPARGGAR
jgi:hypothetical protein